MKVWKHLAVILAGLFVFLGIPTLIFVDFTTLFTAEPASAVTGASMELPEQPSGEFVVLLNTDRTGDTTEQWKLFFSGGDAGVIMSDLDCMAAQSDAAGIQLAERFQARLAENQMQVKRENGLLLISKAQCAQFDVIILSKEMADFYQLQTVLQQDHLVPIIVKGE